jgi:two-component system response regulator
MTKTVLLVEDNPTDEKLTLRALKRGDVPVEVIVARDGAEALDYLFRTGRHAGTPAVAPPTLILLDLKLPRVEGVEVLRRIRADPRTRLLPVVVLTASRENEDLEQCFALGANAYVRKPVDFGEFVEAARTLGLFWLIYNEPPPQGAPA